MCTRGQALPGPTRKLIFNVILFALREKEAKRNLIDLNKAMERVAAMTGLSRDTVCKIKKEGMTNGGVWRTPGANRTGRPKKFVLDDLDKCVVRSKIDEFYSIRKEVPTLRKLLKVLREDMNFGGSVDTLRRLLYDMGFKFNKCQSKKLTITHVETLS